MVSWSQGLLAIRRHFDVEALFNPFALKKEIINGSGDGALVPSLRLKSCFCEFEIAQDFNQVFPLIGEVRFQDRARVVTFFDLIIGTNIAG